MTPGIPQDSRSREKISGCSARICVQNFDTVLAMLVKLAGEASFDNILPGHIKTHSKTPINFILCYFSKSQDSENGFPR